MPSQKKMREIQEAGPIVFKKILEIFRAAKIPFICPSGTALGLYRDGKLIETDTDLDFLLPAGIIGNGNVKLLLSAIPYKIGCNTEHQLTLTTLKPAIICDFQFYRSHQSGYAIKAPHFFFFEASELDYPHIIQHPDYGPVPIPSNPEGYFARKYGPDWHIPKYQQKRVVS